MCFFPWTQNEWRAFEEIESLTENLNHKFLEQICQNAEILPWAKLNYLVTICGLACDSFIGQKELKQ